MKIVSWNINGFRSACKKELFTRLIGLEDPDLIFLQEIKTNLADAQKVASMYDPSILSKYRWFFTPSVIPGRHGVALLAKESFLTDEEGNSRIKKLPDRIDPVIDDSPEGRLQVFMMGDTLIINTYTVNVRQDLSRIVQREKYDQAIRNILTDWTKRGNTKIILLGDFNVVNEPIDYHGGNIDPSLAGMTDDERDSFKSMLKLFNLKDAYRHFFPTEKAYSYWSYRGYARDSNKGWRIDYALVSQDLLESVEYSDILTDMMGSDHAPIVLELK